MNKVTVDKKEVLKKIKENCKNHRNIFLKAQKGYKKAIIKELNEMLKAAREGRLVLKYIELTEPTDHTNDYNRAINMLEMSIDDSIRLSEERFDNLVLDNWEWSNQFTTTNAIYIGK